MQRNLSEQPGSLVHCTAHGLTIVSDSEGMVVIGILCARAHWSEVDMRSNARNLHTLEIAKAWVALNDIDAANVQQHINTFAPKS